LTADQVREIRKVYKYADRMQKARGIKKAPNGMAQRLATLHGVSRETIAHIRKGDRWSTLK
jgi:DNA-binding XRE family transcriptional regulator